MATVKGTEPSIGVLVSVESACGSMRAVTSTFRPAYVRHIPTKRVPYSAAKRSLDIIVALVALIVLSPIILIVAAAVRLTSRGPVIFSQRRVGEGGEEFLCFKFRSMCVDAEERKVSLLALNELSGPVFKIKHDPRVTRVGRIIRKLSLDELPQLWNVLKGEMSIVGPRPPVPSEVQEYNPYALGRLSVKPGLTCLWQINGRNNISFEHWVELDLLYIETMSFWGDLKIILKTIPAVLSGRGAH